MDTVEVIFLSQICRKISRVIIDPFHFNNGQHQVLRVPLQAYAAESVKSRFGPTCNFGILNFTANNLNFDVPKLELAFLQVVCFPCFMQKKKCYNQAR
jgi:hypothetical protein